jgi:hypothetical protein
MNQSIQQWLQELVPITQIVQICNQVLPAFVLVGWMLLLIGLVIGMAGREEVVTPITSTIVVACAIAAAPWFVTIAESIANGLVGAIAAVAPNMNWLPVANPGPNALSMNFSAPFAIIGKYVAGSFANPPPAALWELGHWTDYIFRGVVIAITGAVACVTVFVMQVMLILQWLIVTSSKLLLPIFIACLSIPASRGAAQNFIKGILGVICWPVGWMIAHIGTMAALGNLTPPSWNASLFQLVLSLMALGVVCLWMIVATLGAPRLIARAVTSGTNFAAGLVGGFASAAGQHAASGVQSGATVAGALAGSSMGPAGAALGESVGSMAGGAGAALITSATQAAEGINGEVQAVPNSRSAGIADAAIAGIKARAKA